MIFSEDYYFQEKFSRLELTDDVIKGVVFEECNFNASSFTGCKFQKCKFLDCTFIDCILSAVVPMDCKLDGVRFLKCMASGIDWTKTEKTAGISFNRSQVNYSNFKLMNLPELKILESAAKESDFTEADLSYGDFKGTDFEKTRFLKTNLSHADFRDAKNYDIDARNNTLKQTRFSLPEALSLLNSLDIIID